VEIITSKSNPKIKLAASLKEKKYRLENKMFLIEGKKVLEMGLSMGLVDSIFTKNEIKNIDDKVKVYRVNDEILDKISYEKNPEGIVAICRFPEFKKEYGRFSKIVYLDDVNDPGNMGTIIRTALALNYDAVVMSKNCVDIFNPKVVTAARGALFMLPTFVDDLGVFSDREIIVSALSKNAVSLEKVLRKDRFVLVLGNESHGVSEHTLELANQIVKIDISDKIDSLNVAIAGAILMEKLR